MTAIKQKAISMIENLPEEKILLLLNFLQNLNEQTEKNNRLAEKEKAFSELENLRIKAPDLDYKKELQSCREERFGIANFG